MISKAFKDCVRELKKVFLDLNDRVKNNLFCLDEETFDLLRNEAGDLIEKISPMAEQAKAKKDKSLPSLDRLLTKVNDCIRELDIANLEAKLKAYWKVRTANKAPSMNFVDRYDLIVSFTNWIQIFENFLDLNNVCNDEATTLFAHQFLYNGTSHKADEVCDA